MAPDIDPIAFSLGPLDVHWYGLMYLVGFLAAWWLGAVRAPRHGWKGEEMADLIFYAAMGVIIGGRLGYVFFYKPGDFFANPLFLFAIQNGGMSFHGGLLGVLTAMGLYARKTGRTFFATTDFVAPLVPPGILAGRLGNYVNGELWGAPTDGPWGVIFSKVDQLPRHPSQLYEAALEGLLLFVVLFWFTRRPRPVMAASGIFLLGYGASRFAVEFVREPDQHLGYLAFDWLTMGQVLTSPMLVLGAVLLILAYRRPQPAIDEQATAAARETVPTPQAAPDNTSKPGRTANKRKRAGKRRR
jgi:phosphatidylglycerol:prolipoprotein diacylglycerol transferase